MSIRQRKWKQPDGSLLKGWLVDVTWRHVDGRRERIRERPSRNTRAGAEARERAILEALNNGTFRRAGEPAPAAPAQVPTLVTWAKRVLEVAELENKPGTVAEKRSVLRKHLLPALGHLRLDAIGPEQVDAYKAAKLKAALNRKSINNHLAYVSRALRLAEEYQVIKTAPRVKAFKVDKPPIAFLERDESERFLAAALPAHRTFLLVLLRAGLRISEAVALRWEDIDLRREHLTVRRSAYRAIEITPKSNKSRTIPLSNDLLQALRGP